MTINILEIILGALAIVAGKLLFYAVLKILDYYDVI